MGDLPVYCRHPWQRFVKQVEMHPEGYFYFTWQKGHVLDKHTCYIEAGLVEQKEAEWHSEADVLADKGAQRHPFDSKLWMGAQA